MDTLIREKKVPSKMHSFQKKGSSCNFFQLSYLALCVQWNWHIGRINVIIEALSEAGQAPN